MSFLEEQREKAVYVAEKCIECGRCFQYCPFDIFPKNHLKAYYLIRQANSSVLFNTPISNELRKMLYQCSMCDRCYDVCPENIHRADANLFQKLKLNYPIKQKFNFPSILPSLKIGLSRVSISKKSKEEKAWTKTLNTFDNAKVMVYHGCYVNFTTDTCMKLENILSKADEDYTSVGGKSFCCGGINGYRGINTFKSSYPKLKKVIEKINPFEIITSCGHCYEVLSRIVYEMDVDIKVRHSSEKILELVQDKKIRLHKLDTSVTIQDACLLPHLYPDNAAIRTLLRKFLHVKDMDSSKEVSNCCGNISWAFDSRMVHKQIEKVSKEYHQTKTSHVATYCPRCMEVMERSKSNTDPVDYIDLIYDSIFQKQKPTKEDFVPKPDKKTNQDENILSIENSSSNKDDEKSSTKTARTNPISTAKDKHAKTLKKNIKKTSSKIKKKIEKNIEKSSEKGKKTKKKR